MQRDMFASGLAAQIGMNAFGVWQAVKAHADFESGEAWPSMRRLGDMTGLSVGAVHKSVDTLLQARLLRVVTKGNRGRGSTYVARERMDVRLGERVLCTIVLDYVPATLRKTLADISEAVKGDVASPEVFAACEVIPGDGFVWDASSGLLRASIPASDIPRSPDDGFPQLPPGSNGLLS